MIRWLRRHWWEWTPLGAIAIITLVVVVTCGGCASTTITTPSGVVYSSNRDSQLDELYYEKTIAPDGTETTILQINGAKGSASPVIGSQTDFLRALFEAAFAAGLRAAPGG